MSGIVRHEKKVEELRNAAWMIAFVASIGNGFGFLNAIFYAFAASVAVKALACSPRFAIHFASVLRMRWRKINALLFVATAIIAVSASGLLPFEAVHLLRIILYIVIFRVLLEVWRTGITTVRTLPART